MFEIEREVRTGEVQQVGDYEITPLTNVFIAKFHGHHGGLIWNRPRAVIVRSMDGEEKILPVRDVTRNIIWGMLAGAMLGAMLIGMMKRTTNLSANIKE
jgi:hypothetical protein